MASLRIPSVLALFSLLLLVACGSDDSGAKPGTGPGGSDPNALPTGVTRIACMVQSASHCSMKGADSQADIDSEKSDCTDMSGAPEDHCPSDGLIGCCVLAGLGDCYYEAGAAQSAQSACAQTGLTWETTAP